MDDSISRLDSLSIDDGSSKVSEESQEESIFLNKTSSLSLNEQVSNTKSPFHRHYPIRPSPLRRSYSNDNDSEMIDASDIDDSDSIMEDVSNNSFTERIGKTTSLILSPTILGAKVATNSISSPYRVNLLDKLKDAGDDELHSSDNSSNCSSIQENTSFNSIKSRNKPRTPSSLSRYVITNETDTETETETELDTETEQENTDDSIVESTIDSCTVQHYQTPAVDARWKNQPIQLQMHHHHYYPATPTTPSAYDEDEDSLLPAPWSKFAKPKAPTPYIISSYLQLLFNAFTSGIILYVLISAIKAVKSDINSKIEEHQTDLIIDIQGCSKSYYANRCDAERRPPDLEDDCIRWEKCMNRDPSQIASKTSVSAETLGIILNSLIEPIGAKAIVVFVLGFMVWSFASNFIFGFVRAKSYYGWSNKNSQNLLQQQQQEQQQQLQNFNQTPMKAIPFSND